MGEKTGYHPMSLHVIRGAAEYCGFKIGKMERIAQMPNEGKAIYSVVIQDAPKGWRDWPITTYRKQLQHCFMDDIRVTDVKMALGKPVRVTLVVQLGRSPLDAALEKLSNE